ncbi:MAG: pullulanase [Ignavibacteria bacterium]|jgi:pullulanase/glycogen debranching enzyme|nr:pullulanase [Ignavibacteria bacterium]MCU7502700.1 pullulanase [Ignavibacteria bacterium]MCU7517371.1 pullulanase [Ignavibacteria bacterium]
MKTIIHLLALTLTLFSYSNNIGASVYISDKKEKDILTREESKKIIQSDLNRYYTDKKLGSFVENGKTYFRLFAPTADRVTLVTYMKPGDNKPISYEMKSDTAGVWEAVIDGEKYGLFYGFKIGREGQNHQDVICLDPYARAVATYNTYMNPRLAIVVKDGTYDWEGDKPVERDWRDLIVYEMHLRDMTAHPSSGARQPGTYRGLIEKGIKGGLNYIRDLGVNTVELLPAQEFANIEIPYRDSMAGRFNTWNPYERNHWGYMTASFFAPEAYYTEKEFKWNSWMGSRAEQIDQFKDMVKAFHKDGIAVIMDVVYNHISEYELGNLKEIDSKYYFRFDERGNYRAESGCGNDFKTERPMARRMIIESLLYWMKEYHVDGFRFDLGKMIDWETVEEIIREAKKVNPSVVIVCEPWGGGYDPMGFSLRGWGSWNDQIRNGIKGENPTNGHGWIFGKWYGNNNMGRIKSYVNGTLVRDSLGLFQKKEHSVNYLESHDGLTLGDFIRIGTKEVDQNKVIKDVDENAKLTPVQLKLNKLAALFLFTSQGMTMISEGQEFARSKVIPLDVKVPDENKGKIDHNSYNKDNATNYINYKHADMNKDLVDYYKGLIKLRSNYAAFRRAAYEDVSFMEVPGKAFSLGFKVLFEGDDFIVLFNAENSGEVRFSLPEGNWDILVNADKSGIDPLGTISKEAKLGPKTGLVLKKQK